MVLTEKTAFQHRLEVQPNEVIDRLRTVQFTFNGQPYTAFEGDTIASALAANGVRIVARSFKYHRPRGLMAYGHSMNAMVQIEDRVSESIWHVKVENGIDVMPVNVWPSLERDAMSLTQLGSRFLPIGFYYKTFIRPKSLWPTYEKILRNTAGLGKLNTNTTLDRSYDKQYLHADIIVVGAGPAGLSAAIAAGKTGARVLLLDEGSHVGGHQRFRQNDESAALRDQLAELPNVLVFTDTVVQGYFEDHWLFAVRGKRLFKIRGKAVVFATGAEDQPLIFDNNDLPGVVMGSATERLLHGYGTVVGSNPLIVTANDDGWRLARDLQTAGVAVAAVADHRKDGGELAQSVIGMGIKAYWQYSVVAAQGRQAVVSAEIAPIFNPTSKTKIACDSIILSTAWTPRFDLPYQAGCTFAYDNKRHEHLPLSSPDGVFLAGRVTGTHNVGNQITEGELMGQEAAAYAGFGKKPTPQRKSALTRKKSAEPPRSSPHFHFVGNLKAKRFVDLDEDVSDEDVKDAIAEGYDSIELLKRYSTISMGPSQGKWSSLNTMRLVSDINNWTMNETGKTTSRPPVRPIKFANLGGQLLEPVRYTPLHQWHLEHGADMMVAGLWMRPQHYGNPEHEVKKVRERVGLIDVSTLGKIKLTGSGVPALLDKLYINKFSKLKVGRVRYGLMCNAEGVIMDDGVTARVGENEWYMTTTSGGAGTVYEWIQWWIQSGWGDNVHVTSVTEGRAAFNLAGPRTRDVLAKLTDTDLANEAIPYMSVRDITIADVPCRIMRIGFTGELSYEIHAPASRALAVWKNLMDAGAEFGIVPFGVEAQRILRLEKGHIIIGQDTDALTDPIMANQAWAVKLEKEDFLGKRLIARSAPSTGPSSSSGGASGCSENGTKQKLIGFKMESQLIVPEEGLQIVRQVPKSDKHPIGLQIIGWVTSCKHSPTLNQIIGLCWLPSALADEHGARFFIRREGELLGATVWHGAFYNPDGSLLKS